MIAFHIKRGGALRHNHHSDPPRILLPPIVGIRCCAVFGMGNKPFTTDRILRDIDVQSDATFVALQPEQSSPLTANKTS